MEYILCYNRSVALLCITATTVLFGSAAHRAGVVQVRTPRFQRGDAGINSSRPLQYPATGMVLGTA